MLISARQNKIASAAFTLIELAIVLGVTGLVFGGLWRLMSSGNSQMRDQAAASQHQQLAASVNNFLATAQGSALLRQMAANERVVLSMPIAANPAGSAACTANIPVVTANGVNMTVADLCTLLPAGFSAGSTNAYGQTFLTRVMKDGNASGSDPAAYSYMIITRAGDVIPDASGGRISAMIGGDGAFLYTDNVCTPGGSTDHRKAACGSYGSWTVGDITGAAATGGYGFADTDAVSGHIVSRTYSTVAKNSIDNYLWRTVQTDRRYNTMFSDVYFDQTVNGGTSTPGTNILMVGNGAVGGTAGGGNIATYEGSISLGNIASVTADRTIFVNGGFVSMNAGTLNLEGGVVNGSAASRIEMAGGAVNMQGGTLSTGGGMINLNNAGGIDAGGAAARIDMRGSPINMNVAGAAGGGGQINLQGGQIRFSGVNNSQGTGRIDDTTFGPQMNFDSVTPLLNAGGIRSFIQLNTNCSIETNPNCNPAINITTGDISVGNRLNANSLFAVTFIYNSSDRRLKQDIKPLAGQLDKLRNVEPVSYSLKKSGEKSMGVIAQDIEKIYPEVVTTNADGYKAVNYSGLIAPLIAAVQELSKKNSEMKIQLEKQQNQIDALLAKKK